MVDPFDMEDVVIDKLKLPVLRRLLLIKFCLSKAVVEFVKQIAPVIYQTLHNLRTTRKWSHFCSRFSNKETINTIDFE